MKKSLQTDMIELNLLDKEARLKEIDSEIESLKQERKQIKEWLNVNNSKNKHPDLFE